MQGIPFYSNATFKSVHLEHFLANPRGGTPLESCDLAFFDLKIDLKIDLKSDLDFVGCDRSKILRKNYQELKAEQIFDLNH